MNKIDKSIKTAGKAAIAKAGEGKPALHAIKGGKPAPAKPWDGAEGLEWTIPSPAPYHTFTTPPEVK